MITQVPDAGLDLRVEGITVLGGAAFDHITNEIAGAVQIDDGKHFVQELSGPAHKGAAGQILLLAGALADEHEIGGAEPFAKDHMVSCFT